MCIMVMAGLGEQQGSVLPPSWDGRGQDGQTALRVGEGCWMWAGSSCDKLLRMRVWPPYSLHPNVLLFLLLWGHKFGARVDYCK